MAPNDWKDVLVLAASALMLCGAAFSWHRSRRHARAAKAEREAAEAASKLAWLHTANIEHTLTRLDSMLPPDVIPFPVDQLAPPRVRLRIAKGTGEGGA